MTSKVRVAVLGASGYTGSEFVRLAHDHPGINLAALSANAQADQPYHKVFPAFLGLGLPDLVTVDQIDFSQIDAVILCLPHTKSQEIVAKLWDKYPKLKFVDLAADFRLDDPAQYDEVYSTHLAPGIQPHAVYGLTERNRAKVMGARLVACPGCFPTGALSVLLPLLQAGVASDRGIIVDSKTGVTGAGRQAAQAFLFSEVNESVHSYGLGGHRHRPEMEQELSKTTGQDTEITFIPHLVGKSRGILSTCYMKLADGKSLEDARTALENTARQEPMVHYSDESAAIATRFVRGTNRVVLGAFQGRTSRDLIAISAIDNLTKGSSGQALQNFNLMFGFDEALGLNATALFP